MAVPNDLNLDTNLLLTGSNASGKSTFMKAVALNVIMAQSLNIATAESFNYQPGYVLLQWLTQMMYSQGTAILWLN